MLTVLLGVGVGAGALVVLSAWWAPLPGPVTPADRFELPKFDVAWLALWQIPVAVGVALAAWVVSGWAPLGIGLATLVLVGPALLSTSSAEADFAHRTEAVAGWVETLRDTMRGHRGIEAAIRVTSDNAPLAIRVPLQRMTRRIAMGVGLRDAMADCADEVDNPVFDLIVAVLLNALSVSANQVPAMLDEIAVQARDRAHSHLQVHTSREKQRTQLRLVGIIVIVTIIGFLVMFGPYLAPLGSPAGQVVLSGAACCVGALLLWIASLSARQPAARMLDPRRALTAADGVRP